MNDYGKCGTCGEPFLKSRGILYEVKPGIDNHAEFTIHGCQIKDHKTQLIDLTSYKAAMLLIDLPALDKRLSIDMNYQPKSANRYIGACNLNQRLYDASAKATDFLTLTPEIQADSLSTLIDYLRSKGYIVTDIGPVERDEHGQLSHKVTYQKPIAKGPEHG